MGYRPTSFSQEIKNQRHLAFWEEENKRNNYANSLEGFENLHSQSGVKEWEEFLDHYLIDLHNNRATLTHKEFTDKVLEFYLVFGCEEIESFIDGISHDQIHKYRERYNLSTKESLLIDDFVEKLPCERYTYVLNYFNEVVKDKYSDRINNKNNWSDDYDLDEYDLRIISEAKLALWDNNPRFFAYEWDQFCEDKKDEGIFFDIEEEETSIFENKFDHEKYHQEMLATYLPSGKYYIGDLVNINDIEGNGEEKYWYFQNKNGVFKAKLGTSYVNINTAQGDGFFKDNHGNTHWVDSGSIGCISIEEIELPEKGGFIFDFPEPFNCNFDSSKGIIRFGSVYILTDELMDNGHDPIYFFDEHNPYESSHARNKTCSFIHVKQIIDSENFNINEKSKKKINLQISEFIEKRITYEVNIFGERLKKSENPTNKLLFAFANEIRNFESNNKTNFNKEIYDYLILAKEDIYSWVIKIMNSESSFEANKGSYNVDMLGRPAKPVKVSFDERTLLKGINFQTVENLINLCIKELDKDAV